MDYLKIFRYVISGGTAALVNLTTLFALTEWFAVWYLLSSIFAFLLAVFVSFTLQKFWTFREKSMRRVRRQFVAFLIVTTGSLSLNTLLVYSLVEGWRLQYLLSQIIAGALIAVISFRVYQRAIFSPAVSN
ncbi:MAG: GtrA family protein [Candidatus Vogelbacteria bacterium]|nr:GtrA family protein [Candidatus Vogelbacteria bacterium]